ncbi:hypothetical protein NQ318_004405 [Aromia moschata]|uniref:Uncharacterized protein n=1 Tax=Aromia moschata TaxID=1265417 RepID=A0AAV8Y5S1_9CUCU|nr:hypothetical protein NQ318_004405 [Aromia moschata]
MVFKNTTDQIHRNCINIHSWYTAGSPRQQGHCKEISTSSVEYFQYAYDTCPGRNGVYKGGMGVAPVVPHPVLPHIEITEAEVISKQRGQLYEISATATLPALKDPEEFSCKLHIPQANYTTRRETVFYPGLHTIKT